MSQKPRLLRLFASDSKCFDVAIDHGVFHNSEFLAGIEDLPAAVETLVTAGPDAIQLGPGQARLLQRRAGPAKPALVMRADSANVYGPSRPQNLFCVLNAAPVENALRWDAAAVVVNLFQAPGQTGLYRQCLSNIATLQPACERYGMPLMVEPLVLEPGKREDYDSSGDTIRIATLVRQAVELGADLIKCDPPSESEEFHRLVEAGSGIPVLARGGGRMNELAVFQRTSEFMRQGASGIVYGRNIIQHPRPLQMTRALMAIVHRDASPEEAAGILEQR
jgi:DhnA family fructose-bisphosphate aldolase class Ia